MKPYKLALVLGRFQGIHKGHESIINRALEMADNVLIFIGSSQEEGTKKNPFSYELRRKMLRDIYPADNVYIYPLPDLGVGNVPKWGDYVMENAAKVLGLPDLIIFGAEVKCNTWYLNYPNMTSVTVDRGIIDINATRLREIIQKDDKKEFEKYVNPVLYKYYEELRKIIISVGGMTC